MYEKIKAWFKRNWPHILSFGLTFIIGVLVGRRNRNGTDADIERLHNNIEELGTELSAARETIGFLERENQQLDTETRELAEEIREMERIYKLSKEYHTKAGSDIEQLGTIKKRLEGVLEKYREKIGKSGKDE